METKENKNEAKLISFSDMRKEWWKISWTYQKGPYFFLIGLMICGIFRWIWILDGIISYALWVDTLVPGLLINILWIIFSIWVIAYTFDLINWIDAKIKNFWKWMTWDRIRSGVLWSILSWILIFIWFILLIIPWIIVSVRLIFVLYAIIDKLMDPIEAIKYSWKITKWHFREIVWFELYFMLYNFIGMLCLWVWLIRTWPMTQLATVRYYKLLSEAYDQTVKINKK